MKKSLFLSIFFFSFTLMAMAQEAPVKKSADHGSTVEKKSELAAKVLPAAINAPEKVKADIVFVADTAQFVKIAGKVYPVEYFTKNVPVFMTADAWGEVLNIINLRDYGKQPATVISQILQAISVQLPQQK